MFYPRISLLFSMLFFIFPVGTSGQFTSLQPVSTPVYSPFTYNPAIAGSKDHSGINFLSAIYKNASSQLFSADTRFSKASRPVYFLSEETREFRNIGAGISIFHQYEDTYRTLGGSASLAYHIPVNKKRLSFLSLGASGKGIYFDGEWPGPGDSIFHVLLGGTKYFDLDLGVYYYSARFSGGFSVINLRDLIMNEGRPNTEIIPLSLQYFANASYKILLSRSWNIVFEPGMILSTHELELEGLEEKIYPLLKLYLKDFCLAYYARDNDKLSFLFEYRYPSVFLSAYFEIPKNSAYYRREPSIEISAGIKLGKNKKRVTSRSRW